MVFPDRTNGLWSAMRVVSPLRSGLPLVGSHTDLTTKALPPLAGKEKRSRIRLAVSGPTKGRCSFASRNAKEC
jgi:hypothetical protein